MLMFLRPVVRVQMDIAHESHEIEDEDAKFINKMTVIKFSHGLMYPSADKFLDRLNRILQRGDKHIVLDCQFFTGLDYTGLEAMKRILLIAYQQNKHIIFTNMSDHLLKEIQHIGIDNFNYFDNVDDAIHGKFDEQILCFCDCFMFIYLYRT